MKLNFNFKVKDLSGKEIEGAEANKLLANTLSMLNKGNSMKLYDWAVKLWNGKPLEIDDTDGEVLQELVKNSETLTVLAKKPMLDVIEEGLKPKK